MKNDGTSTKLDERAKARLLLGSIDIENQHGQSAQIEKVLSAWLTEKDVTSLLVTLPLSDEPDLTAFLGRWLESGRALALARVEPAHGLSFRVVTAWESRWTGSEKNLREGPIDAPLWKPSARTLCLVPGLAFAPRSDRGFDRLGRGRGFFDRWLAQRPAGLVTMGVAYRETLWEHVTVGPHDQSVNLLVTADGVLW